MQRKTRSLSYQNKQKAMCYHNTRAASAFPLFGWISKYSISKMEYSLAFHPPELLFSETSFLFLFLFLVPSWYPLGTLLIPAMYNREKGRFKFYFYFILFYSCFGTLLGGNPPAPRAPQQHEVVAWLFSQFCDIEKKKRRKFSPKYQT